MIQNENQSIGMCVRLHWSPKPFVVNTSLNCTTFECWNFFHKSTMLMHLVDCSRKPMWKRKKKCWNQIRIMMRSLNSNFQNVMQYHVIFAGNIWFQLKRVSLCTLTMEVVVFDGWPMFPTKTANGNCQFHLEYLKRFIIISLCMLSVSLLFLLLFLFILQLLTKNGNVWLRSAWIPGFGIASTRFAISLRDRMSFRMSSGIKMAEESWVLGCMLTTFEAGPGYTCTGGCE